MAINKLRSHQHPVVAVGKRRTTVADVQVSTETSSVPDLDTITLYLNPSNQKPYYQYILEAKPKRLIFNPGTENDELADLAKEKGIQPVEACTLVLLATGQY